LIKRNYFLALLITATILLTFAPNTTATETDDLVLEKNYEWVTEDYNYAMGVASADIDADDETEIVTVGYFYNSSWGPPVTYEGELNIWSWNGTSLLLEHAEYYDIWYTWSSDLRLYDTALGNLNNDTETEIVAVGFGKFLDTEELGLLLVGSWNGSSFSRKAEAYWPSEGEFRETKGFGVALGDVDKDNTVEIVVVGYQNTTIMGTGFHGQITIWNMTGNSLNLEASEEWLGVGDTVWRSVAISDVDLDGENEILVVGDFFDSVRSVRCAILKIGTWDGEYFEWEASRQWYTYSDTYCSDIAVGNLDSDGIPDIVTLGYQMDSERSYAQLRIWNWKDELLTLKSSFEGGSASELLTNFGTSLAIGDVDNDKISEIVVGIQVSALFTSMATMRIFAWDGQTLITEGGQDWTNSSVIEGTVCLDVDDDDICEIVTVGYAASMMMSPNSIMAIWSVSKAESQISLELSSKEIIIGEQVTIRGQLLGENSTPIANAEVKLEVEHETGVFQLFTTVKTDENGDFSHSWIPSEVGHYVIRASWNGDFQHVAVANTTELTVNKIPSMITITLSKYSAKIGENVTVSGTLYPAQETSITLQCKAPNGTITMRTAAVDNLGRFSSSFTLDQEGKWQITASWDGNEVYEAAISNSATVIVQALDMTTWILMLTGPILGLVALIIALAAIYLASRKKPAQSSSPTLSTETI